MPGRVPWIRVSLFAQSGRRSFADGGTFLRFLVFTGLVLGLLFCVAMPASAKTVRTGALRGPAFSRAICTVVNAGKKPLKDGVTPTVRRLSGGALISPKPIGGLLPGVGSVSIGAFGGATTDVYCDVDGRVSEKDVKLTLCIAATDDGPCQAALGT
jgi:hypothetical protein